MNRNLIASKRQKNINEIQEDLKANNAQTVENKVENTTVNNTDNINKPSHYVRGPKRNVEKYNATIDEKMQKTLQQDKDNSQKLFATINEDKTGTEFNKYFDNNFNLRDDSTLLQEKKNTLKQKQDELNNYAKVQYDPTVSGFVNNDKGEEYKNNLLLEIDSLNKEINDLDKNVNNQQLIRRTLESDYIQNNGTEEEKEKYRKYLASFQDNYIERLGNAYASSVVDIANIPVQAYEILKTFGTRNAEDKFDFRDKDSMSTILSNTSRELNEYAFNGTTGFEKWSLQTISSLMPMINSVLIGNVAGVAMGLEETALTKGVEAFTNVNLGLQNAGQVTRQRVEEGNDISTAMLNGVVHGTITGLVEGMNAGRVASLFTGDAGKFLLSTALLSKANPAKIFGYLNAMGVEEGAEEIIETIADHIADETTNLVIGAINSSEGTNIQTVNATKIDTQDLLSQFIMAYAGSYLLGAPTAVSMTIDSKAKYNYAMKAKEYFTTAMNSEVSTPEMKQAYANIIRKIDFDTNDYLSKASPVAQAVELASDKVDSIGTFDDAMVIFANAMRSDVQDVSYQAQESLNRTLELEGKFQDALYQRGYNIKAEDYLNFDEKARRETKIALDFGNETGRKITVTRDLGFNGLVNKSTGEIIIDGTREPVLTTLAHELTHTTEDSKFYQTLDDLVSRRFGDANEVANEVNRIKDEYNTKGKQLQKEGKIDSWTDLTLDDARKEFVAKQIEGLFNDETFINDLVKYDSSIANRIYQKLDAFISKDEIKDIKLAFEQAFRENNLGQGEKYSVDIRKNIDNRDILDTNYSQKEIDITHNNGDYIEGIDYTIEEFLNKFANSNKQKLLWLGKVNKELIDRVFYDTGLDLNGKSLVIASDNSVHLQRHNSKNYTKYGNPAPITISTLHNISNILNNYDRVELIKEKGQTRLRFETDTNDDFYYRVIELVPIRNKSSVLVSIYTIKKGDLQGLDANNASNFNTSTNNGNDLNYAPKNNISNSNEDVKYSISELEDKAIQEFGTTTNPYKAGYLMPSGKMLDLSEGQNRRTQDHRVVGVLFDNIDYGRDGMSAGMIQFMNQGNIRLQPEGYGVDISNVVEPTNAQYSSLYDYISNFRDDGFVLDVSDTNGYNVFSMEYEPGTSIRQIINDIKNYFADGTIPEETGFNPVEREMARQFYGDKYQYSLTADEGMENLRKAVEEDGNKEYESVYKDLAQRRDKANAMLDGTLLKEDGSKYNYDEIYEQTGWLFDKNDNILKGEFYDDDTVNKIYNWVNKQKGRGSDFRNDNKNTPLVDVVGKDSLLFTMYPGFKNAYIFASNNLSSTWGSMYPTMPDDINGYMRGDVARIRVGKVKKGYVADPNGRYTNVKTGERVSKKAVPLSENDIKNTIAHELQHGIQLYEHFLYGTPGTRYYDRPGEAESRWVGERQENFGLRWKTPDGIVNLDDEARIQGEGQVLDEGTTEGTISETSGQTPNGQLESSNELEDSTREDGGDFVGESEVESPITPEESDDNLLNNQEEGSDEKVAKILEEMPQPESFLSKLKRAFKIARHEFVDHLDAVDELARKTNNKLISSKADYAMLAPNVASEAILNGHYDLSNGQKIDDGIDKVIQKVGDNKNLFSEYLYHWRNIDTTSMNERFADRYQEALNKRAEEIYYSDAGSGGNITREQAMEKAKEEVTLNKYVFGKSIGLKESQARIAEIEKEHPEFIKLAQQVWDYFNNDLQVLVDYGVITQEDMNTYMEETPHYVPIKRNVDVQRSGKSSLDANKAIMQFKGSDIDLLPFDYSAIKHTEAVYRSAFNNQLYNEIIKTIDPEQMRKIDIAQGNTNIDEVLGSLGNEMNGPVGIDGDNNLYAYYKGSRISVGVNDELASSLKPRMNPFNMPDINPLVSFSEFRRNLITGWNPMFMFTNAIKDIQDAGFNTKYPKSFVRYYAEAWSQILGNGELKNLYIKNGGRSGYITELGSPKLEGKNPFSKALNTVVDINEAVEMAPRLAEFIASLKNGESIETAMYNASEVTTNFKRGGDTAKYINRNGSAFLNASIQGFAKQVRNIQDAKDGGAKGILTYMAKLTLTAGLPLFILNHLMWKDDDEYEELSDYVKQNYYVIKKYGDRKFIKIPKGRISAFFQTVIQDSKNTVQGKAKVWDSLMDVIDSFANNIAPNSVTENSIIAPLVQAYTNKTWYGDDLVPTRLQDLPEEEQYDETTDELSIWLGKKLGASPYKINYVLDQYSGAIGDVGLPMITVQATNGIDNKVLSGLASPWLDKFTTDSTMKNQNVSNFYDLKVELSIASKGANATEEQKLSSKFMNSVNSQVSNLYAQKRQVQLDKSLSNKDKYNKVRDIQRQIDDMVNYALTNYDQIDINNNYASVGGVYYTKSEDGWSKLNAKQMEQLQDAIKNGIEEEDYFDYKENAGTKQAERIEYLENTDLSQEQKEYLYNLGGYKTTYAEAYAKVFGKNKQSKTKKGSQETNSSKTTKTTSSPKITVKSANNASSVKLDVNNKEEMSNFINAYAKVFSGNNSKAKSTDSSLVTCPRCKNRVYPVNGYCPICGYKL